MLPNNNQEIITKMAKHTLKNSGKKYIVLGIAIFLSTFMLFSVFTLGETYLKMQNLQELKLHGHDSDAALMNGYTDAQKKVFEEWEDIVSVGSSSYAGCPIKTERSENLHTAFIYADPVYWNTFMAPARTSVKGRYPEKENELMATKKALKDCGMADLDVGDSFTLTYADLSGEHTRDFVISGIWEGYGPKDFYVSKAFLDKTGYRQERYGILYVKFDRFIITGREKEALNEKLNLSPRQAFSFTAYKEQSVSILTGLAFISFITCLSAYLLIYNILHLSVAGNIRYYGLLQTVGMTEKQLRQFLNKKIFWVGALGIFTGMAAALPCSLSLIPLAAQAFGLKKDQVTVTFHPAVFVGTVLLATLTIYLGNRKPLKTAVNISPMEALGYKRSLPQKDFRKAKKGNPLWAMAWGQLAGDKKKTAVTLTSLTLCLSVFLCLATLIKSQGARSLVSQFTDADLVIENNTQPWKDARDWENVLTDELIQKIRDTPGVTEVDPLIISELVMPWEEDFADLWMRSMNEFFMDEPYEKTLKDYREHPEDYYSFLEGINEREFDTLNAALEKPVDKDAFLRGDVCILGASYILGEANADGKKVTCCIGGENGIRHTFQIAASLDTGYALRTAGGPSLVVSDRFLRENSPIVQTIRLNVSYEKEFDETLEDRLKNILYESSDKNDFFLDSKIETRREIESAQGNMMGVGMGITCILALIGIMNYINTVSCSIQNRKVTLAVMESVGMSGKQTDRMLILEGVLCAGISLLITATAGLFITFLFYQSVNYAKVPFSLPLLPVLGMALLVVLVCMLVPPLAYRVITGKESIVERIHGFE